MIILFAIAGAILLSMLEWRRADTTHRAARIAATFVAVAALAWAGTQSGRKDIEPTLPGTAATLWTDSGGGVAASDVVAGEQFALPNVTSDRKDLTVVPDVSYVRRHLPRIERLHVVGGGLEPFDLPALQNLHVSFQRLGGDVTEARMAFLHVPRDITLGEDVEIHGRVEGLQDGERARVVVKGPDGSETEAAVTPGSTFAVSAAAPGAEGRYLWIVKLVRDEGSTDIEHRVGIAVRAPSLPRVLVLESSPNLETTHLQRWFAEIGARFVSRTLVSGGRYRFSTAEFSAIDAQLLVGFDIVITDPQTLSSLPADEAEAIRAAISREGLGLIVLSRGETSAPTSLSPWKTERAEQDAEHATRIARLQWAELDGPSELPVAIDNMNAEESLPSETSLVSDSRDSAVVRTIPQGRGNIALSLARDTWQWRVQTPELHARYWSFLLSRLAKQAIPEKWVIANAPGEPLFINEPVQLEYTGNVDTSNAPEIVTGADAEHTVLPLMQGVADPQRWSGTFWPRRDGWHRVGIAGGATLDFFVHRTDEWQGLRASRRRVATERFAALSSAVPVRAPEGSIDKLPPSRVSSGLAWFLPFLLSSGYLWWERRRGQKFAL